MSAKEKVALLSAFEKMQEKDRAFVLRLALSLMKRSSSLDYVPPPRLLTE